MRSSSRVRVLMSRVEVRLAAYVAAWMAALLSAVLATFALFLQNEALEEVAANLRADVRGLQESRLWEGPAARAELSKMLAVRGISLRVTELDGSVSSLGGPWPDAHRVREPVGLLTPLRVKRSDFLVRSLAVDHNRSIEAAVSLSHFVGERNEAIGLLLATLLLGSVLASGAAASLVQRALDPLRAATLAVEQIDEEHLGARLPVRGTNDLVDRHAEAVNRVLSRLSRTFVQMRAFSADVAHELRTPINRMLNLSELAMLEAITPDERANTLTRLHVSALAMSHSVDSLLMLASGEEGRIRLNHSRLDLAALLTRMSDLYRAACEHRAIALHVDLEAIQVDGDEQLLNQCLANLFDNALRHAPDGTPIRVSVTRSARGAGIRIEDAGPGIPPEQREYVFDRFVQLDPSRSSGRAGLGLPIARMIARLHRGDITVGDSELGGASFEISLPAVS